MTSALDGIDAVIFDLDGVVTRTAKVHAQAWQEAFAPLPFDPVADYLRYVDGKPREDGVRSFLAARGFGAVIGVDRAGQGAALREHGATHVVSNLAELEAAA